MTAAAHTRPRSITALHDRFLDEPLPEGRRRIVACPPGDVDMWRAIVDHRHPDPDLVFIRPEPGMTDRVVSWLAAIPGYGARGPEDRTDEGPPPPGAIHP